MTSSNTPTGNAPAGGCCCSGKTSRRAPEPAAQVLAAAKPDAGEHASASCCRSAAGKEPGQ